MITQGTFELIAKVVREHEGNVTDVDTPLAERFANELERHNPLFDRERFVADCQSHNYKNEDPTT